VAGSCDIARACSFLTVGVAFGGLRLPCAANTTKSPVMGRARTASPGAGKGMRDRDPGF